MSVSAGQGLSPVSSALQPSTTSETPCFRSMGRGSRAFQFLWMFRVSVNHQAPMTLSYRLLPIDLNLTLDHLASTVVTFGSS